MKTIFNGLSLLILSIVLNKVLVVSAVSNFRQVKTHKFAKDEYYDTIKYEWDITPTNKVGMFDYSVTSNGAVSTLLMNSTDYANWQNKYYPEWVKKHEYTFTYLNDDFRNFQCKSPVAECSRYDIKFPDKKLYVVILRTTLDADISYTFEDDLERLKSRSAKLVYDPKYPNQTTTTTTTTVKTTTVSTTTKKTTTNAASSPTSHSTSETTPSKSNTSTSSESSSNNNNSNGNSNNTNTTTNNNNTSSNNNNNNNTSNNNNNNNNNSNNNNSNNNSNNDSGNSGNTDNVNETNTNDRNDMDGTTSTDNMNGGDNNTYDNNGHYGINFDDEISNKEVDYSRSKWLWPLIVFGTLFLLLLAALLFTNKNRKKKDEINTIHQNTIAANPNNRAGKVAYNPHHALKRAAYKYESNDITVERGSILEITKRYNDGWATVINPKDGKECLVPLIVLEGDIDEDMTNIPVEQKSSKNILATPESLYENNYISQKDYEEMKRNDEWIKKVKLMKYGKPDSAQNIIVDPADQFKYMTENLEDDITQSRPHDNGKSMVATLVNSNTELLNADHILEVCDDDDDYEPEQGEIVKEDL